MTQPDSGASWSPVPGQNAPAQPAAPWAVPNPASDTPGPQWAPGPSPPTGPPPPKPQTRRRKTVPLVLLIVLPLLVVAGAGYAGFLVLNGEKELSDNANRVTITVPRTWSTYDDPDAGRRVDHGSESYTVPDLVTDGFSGYVEVYVKQRPEASAAPAHHALIDEECELLGCISRGTPTEITVNGRTGIEQVLQHPEDEFSRVLTLTSDTLVVTVLGQSVGPSQTVTDVMHSLVIHR